MFIKMNVKELTNGVLTLFETLTNEKIDYIDWRFWNYYTTNGKVYDGEMIAETIKTKYETLMDEEKKNIIKKFGKLSFVY